VDAELVMIIYDFPEYLCLAIFVVCLLFMLYPIWLPIVLQIVLLPFALFKLATNFIGPSMTSKELESRGRLFSNTIAAFAVITDILAVLNSLLSVQQAAFYLTIARLIWDCFFILQMFRGSNDARWFLALGLVSGICADGYVWFSGAFGADTISLLYPVSKGILSVIAVFTLATSASVEEFITQQDYKRINHAMHKYYRDHRDDD